MKPVFKKCVWVIALSSLVVLAGCHNKKKDNVEPPTPLAKDFKPTATVTKLWTAHVGDGAGVTGVRMRPEVVDGVLYAASTDGDIEAIDATSGKTLWSKKSKTHGWFGWGDKKRKDAFYAGGPAVANGLLVIGTLDGHVYGLDAKDGSPRWEANVGAEVITAPALVGGTAFVRTQDGRIYALDTSTGDRRWVYDQGNVPLLSVRGNGGLLAANGVIFFNSDDGKLIALRQDTGDKLWEQKLASGEGRTDIERLDDADGSVILDGSTLYSAAYHGQMMAVDGPSGRPLWSHDFSTFGSLDVSGNAVYGVNDQSQVWAFDKSGGTDLWKNDSLKYRWLTSPAVQGNYVVVGDVEGYVHWMQTGDGALAARERLSKKPIRAQPVVVGDTVYVEDIKGHIGAYRLSTR